MSDRTGSLARRRSIEWASEGSRARRRFVSSDCNEAHLIVKIIDCGEYFYGVVIQNWNTAKRFSAFLRLLRLPCDEMRILRGYSSSSFLYDYVAAWIVPFTIKHHFSPRRFFTSVCTWIHLNLDAVSNAKTRTMSLWRWRRFISAGFTCFNFFFFLVQLAFNESRFCRYHVYIVLWYNRKTFGLASFLARNTSEHGVYILKRVARS